MFEIKGDHYLFITDYHSKFPYVKKVQSPSSATIARLTAECVSLFAPPMEIVTENGPQHVGKPYNDMCRPVEHQTHHYFTEIYPIERKYSKTGNDIQIGMQHLRCTPIDTNLPSPSEIMFNRQVRTHLPSYHPTLVHQKQMDVNGRLQVRRGSLIQYHCRNVEPELAPLHAGQRLRILNKDSHKWCPGEVVAHIHVHMLCKLQMELDCAEPGHT